jgi:hypothetical protein
MRAKSISTTLCLAVVALTAGGLTVPGSVEAAQQARPHTKQQAERNLLRAAPRVWKHGRLAGLIDRHTGLLKTNVQVVCRGRGARGGRTSRRFVCVMRAWPYKARSLQVSYRALRGPYFRVRLLARRSS